ncbi:signal peptidase II [Hydrogenivirga caldilitoris]|uniref:Lipoprotein signal peptidase n=1 Tax=Hydrogenivirga caldilitoris TaxID=246264 RepID=A0A497XMR1_9AQUI|nr:signal peptidase II [Hydrogenivirga caldilitoris]RLJ70217.1 signal peptidase II [Hydrogenivirga caldilitoris]
MGKILRGSTLIYLYTLIGVVFLDLLTKEMAEQFLSEKSYEPLPFLKLFLIYNKGAAFGIFSGAPDWIRIPILVVTPVIAFAVTYIYSRRDSNLLISVIMGLIAGGALGNLYDRLFLGKVRDFIHLHIGEHYWPAFNIADASITTAVLLLVIGQLKK